MDMVRAYPGITRSVVAAICGITYWSARYWLEKLVVEGRIKSERVYTFRKFVRRVYYYPIPPPRVYYRTSYSEMYYAEDPRTGKNQSPDPIGESRVTVVSDKPGQYDITRFRRVCIYTGLILAPQTFWLVQPYIITAYELDEEIDVEELPYSVPVHKRLNYCERYAVFFKSRQRPTTEWWRYTNPEWYEKFPPVTPTVRAGDYEYNERFIKEAEERAIDLKVLRYRFDNVLGEMVAVE